MLRVPEVRIKPRPSKNLSRIDKAAKIVSLGNFCTNPKSTRAVPSRIYPIIAALNLPHFGRRHESNTKGDKKAPTLIDLTIY